MGVSVFVSAQPRCAVVVGPQGCGKTRRAGEVAARLGLRSQPDLEWWPGAPLPAGCVVTANASVGDLLAAYPTGQWAPMEADHAAA